MKRSRGGARATQRPALITLLELGISKFRKDERHVEQIQNQEIYMPEHGFILVDLIATSFKLRTIYATSPITQCSGRPANQSVNVATRSG